MKTKYLLFTLLIASLMLTACSGSDSDLSSGDSGDGWELVKEDNDSPWESRLAGLQ